MRDVLYVGLCVLALVVGSSGAVRGHSLPDRAEPAVGSIVPASPARVRIWFDSALESTLSRLRVQNEKGREVDNGDGHVSSFDPKLIEVTLPSIPPGKYHVFWNIVSRDGHHMEGHYTFTVR